MLVVAGAALSPRPAQAAMADPHPGDLDPAYGNQGLVTDPGPFGISPAVAVQSGDGKAVVAASDGGSHFVVMRYRTDGSPDGDFGSGGRVVTSINHSGSVHATAVAIQPDGKIVVSGSAGNADQGDFVVLRYLPDGRLDQSFGSGGQVITDFHGRSDSADGGIAIGGGKIVVAGWTSRVSGFAWDFGVARYDMADGRLDPTFGGDGRVITDLLGDDDMAQSVAIQSDGRTIVAGTSYGGSAVDDAFTFVRYNTDGSLDRSFDDDGKVVTDIGFGDWGKDVAIQPDGRIVAGGRTVAAGSPDDQFAVLRYLPDGTLDRDFGSDGKVLTDAGEGWDFLSGIALQSSSQGGGSPKIVAVGGSHPGFNDAHYSVVRYDQAGRLDVGFGDGGIAHTDVNPDNSDEASDVALQADGRILAVGHSGTSLALARYLSSGTPDPDPCTTQEVTFGNIVAVGCFSWTDGAWRAADTTVRVNGIDFESPGKITLDPDGLSLSVDGEVTVSAGDVTLLVTKDLKWSLDAEATLSLPEGFKLKGFPIEGSATFGWTGGIAKVLLHVKLPEALGGVSGKAGFAANNEEGLQLESMSIVVEKARIGGRLELKDLSVDYKRDGNQWTGKGTIVLPTPNSVELSAEMTLSDGRFVSGSVRVDHLQQHIADGVFLQSLSFAVNTGPLSLTGGAGLSAGPAVEGKMAAELNGTMTYTFADPDVFAVAGQLKVVDLELANGSIEYRSTGKIDLAGNLQFERLGLTVNGELAGWIDGTRALNIEGTATVGVSSFLLTGKAVVSTVGMAACGTVEGFLGEASLGVGYKWNQSVDFLTGCDLGPYSARHRTAAGPQPEYLIPAGLKVAAFRIAGTTAPPRVTLVGPNGERVEMPDKDGLTRDKHLVVTNPVTKTTYVALGRPAAGTWRIELQSGSSPIAETRQADGLPPVAVDGSVRRVVDKRCLACPATFVLDWKLKSISGQEVTFAEVGDETSRVIGTANGESGSIAFKPGPGHGERKIVAVVKQDGLPRANISIAGFEP